MLVAFAVLLALLKGPINKLTHGLNNLSIFLSYEPCALCAGFFIFVPMRKILLILAVLAGFTGWAQEKTISKRLQN